jgi:hypothetical protein
LRAWFRNRPTSAFVHGPSPQWLTSLPALCAALRAKGNRGAWTAHRLLEMAWNSLAALINSCLTSPSAAFRSQQLDLLGEPLAALTSAAATTQAADLTGRIVDHCRQHRDAVTRCVIAALRAAAASPAGTRQDDAFVQLASSQVTVLRARLARPVRASDDWSVELPEGCACELCSTLRDFLADSRRRTREWPLAKDRRSHVHSRIDQAELPVTHQTRRQGRPYTLVLTKTAELFEREAQQRTRDQADLVWLLEQWSSTRGEAPGA